MHVHRCYISCLRRRCLLPNMTRTGLLVLPSLCSPPTGFCHPPLLSSPGISCLRVLTSTWILSFYPILRCPFAVRVGLVQYPDIRLSLACRSFVFQGESRSKVRPVVRCHRARTLSFERGKKLIPLFLRLLAASLLPRPPKIGKLRLRQDCSCRLPSSPGGWRVLHYHSLFAKAVCRQTTLVRANMRPPSCIVVFTQWAAVLCGLVMLFGIAEGRFPGAHSLAAASIRNPPHTHQHDLIDSGSVPELRALADPPVPGYGYGYGNPLVLTSSAAAGMTFQNACPPGSHPRNWVYIHIRYLTSYHARNLPRFCYGFAAPVGHLRDCLLRDYLRDGYSVDSR